MGTVYLCHVCSVQYFVNGPAQLRPCRRQCKRIPLCALPSQQCTEASCVHEGSGLPSVSSTQGSGIRMWRTGVSGRRPALSVRARLRRVHESCRVALEVHDFKCTGQTPSAIMRGTRSRRTGSRMNGGGDIGAAPASSECSARVITCSWATRWNPWMIRVGISR